MASETGTTPPSLASVSPTGASREGRQDRLTRLFQDLEKSITRYDFLGLLRLLECLQGDYARLGQATQPRDECFRLSQDPNLAFAPSTFSSFTPATAHGPPRLAVHFMGCWGPNGPLPLHLTEYAKSRLENANDPTLVRFLDIFHHRLLSLFYRAWANSEPVTALDRPQTDRFAYYLGSLFGLGFSSLRNRTELADYSKLYYAGLFADQRCNAAGLEQIINDYFGIPGQLEEFIGEWLPLLPEDRWSLGQKAPPFCLGTNSIIGANTWQRQTKFRLSFGPLKESDFRSFLPGGERLQKLVDLVRSYTGDTFAWDIRLIPHKRESQAFLLGGEGRLGWTTWMGACNKGGFKEDLIFSPMQDSFSTTPSLNT